MEIPGKKVENDCKKPKRKLEIGIELENNRKWSEKLLEVPVKKLEDWLALEKPLEGNWKATKNPLQATKRVLWKNWKATSVKDLERNSKGAENSI